MYNNLRPTAQNTVASSVFTFDSLVEKVEALYTEGKINKETRKEFLLTLLNTRLNIADMTFNPALGLTEKMITDEFIQRYTQQIKDLDPSFTNTSFANAGVPKGKCKLSISYTSNLGGAQMGLYTVNSSSTKNKIRKGQTNEHLVDNGECTIIFHYNFKKFPFTFNVQDSASFSFKCKSFTIELE